MSTSAAIVRRIVLVSARHPEIVRLLVHEGAKGGERLGHILERLATPRRLVAPLFQRVQRQGFLQQFDEDTFFLFLLTAGVMPFALPALTARLMGEDILAEERAERHADGSSRRSSTRAAECLFRDGGSISDATP